MEHRVVLPEPDGPDERHDLVVTDGQGGVIERDDFFVAGGIHLAHRLELQRGQRSVGRCDHEALPMAEAGSTRSTRRNENALPTMAASTSATLLMTTRLGSSWYGMAPGGNTTSSSTANPVPTTAAISATMAACATTPPEERARTRTDRFQHAVQPDALHGEQCKEQRHDHDGDDERHADDLVEHRTLLLHSADRVGCVGA